MKQPYIINKTVLKEPSREDSIYPAFIQYAKRHYPGIEVFANVVGDLRIHGMDKNQYRRLQQKATEKGMVKSMPDLLINASSRGFNLLRIESKKAGTRIFKQDGELLKDDHVFAQACYLSRLTRLGNLAVFCAGLANHIRLLDWYMNPERNDIELEQYEFVGSNGYTPEEGMIYKIRFI